MPQNPLSDLVVTNAGTILRSVDTLQLTGDGVTVTPGSPNPRVAVIDIPGGGTPTLAAGALLGNPGTVSAAGTDVTVGSGLTITSGGSLEATGGGGGGYVFTDGIGISTDTITNPGTVTIGNTGTIVLPAATGTVQASGILLRAGAGYGTSGNGFYGAFTNVYGGAAQGPGNADVQIRGGNANLLGGHATLTSPGTQVVSGGAFAGQAGYAYYSDWSPALGAVFGGNGGTINQATGTATGGSGYMAGGAAYTGAVTNIGGDFSISGGNATTKGGNLTISPGLGMTNGVVIFNNLGTADPMVTNAAFLGVSNGITLSTGP